MKIEVDVLIRFSEGTFARFLDQQRKFRVAVGDRQTEKRLWFLARTRWYERKLARQRYQDHGQKREHGVVTAKRETAFGQFVRQQNYFRLLAENAAAQIHAMVTARRRRRELDAQFEADHARCEARLACDRRRVAEGVRIRERATRYCNSRFTLRVPGWGNLGHGNRWVSKHIGGED